MAVSCFLSFECFTFFISTSKTSTAFGGIRPLTPCDPYASDGGITRTRLPPLHIPTVPSSQP